MPVTPLHVGPGVLLKAIGGPRVSLTLFAATQFTMDLEVLARLVAGAGHLHGFTNTLLGATLVLMVTVPVGRPVCQWLLRWWNRHLAPGLERWLRMESDISWAAAWTGGALGVYSHWFLDAVMHFDARPFAPFSAARPMVGMVSVDALTWICVGSLAAGAILLAVPGLVRLVKR